MLALLQVCACYILPFYVHYLLQAYLSKMYLSFPISLHHALYATSIFTSISTQATIPVKRANTARLENIQVAEPGLTPSGSRNQYGCIRTQTLMRHDFTNSYGAPFVGKH